MNRPRLGALFLPAIALALGGMTDTGSAPRLPRDPPPRPIEPSEPQDWSNIRFTTRSLTPAAAERRYGTAHNDHFERAAARRELQGERRARLIRFARFCQLAERGRIEGA